MLARRGRAASQRAEGSLGISAPRSWRSSSRLGLSSQRFFLAAARSGSPLESTTTLACMRDAAVDEVGEIIGRQALAEGAGEDGDVAGFEVVVDALSRSSVSSGVTTKPRSRRWVSMWLLGSRMVMFSRVLPATSTKRQRMRPGPADMSCSWKNSRSAAPTKPVAMESVPSWARARADVGGFAGGEAGDLAGLLVAADVEVGAFQDAVDGGIEADGEDGHRAPGDELISSVYNGSGTGPSRSVDR